MVCICKWSFGQVPLYTNDQKYQLKSRIYKFTPKYYITLVVSYFQMPISEAGTTRTWLSGSSITSIHDTTRNPMILFPGVVPPSCPDKPLRKHSVYKHRIIEYKNNLRIPVHIQSFCSLVSVSVSLVLVPDI